MGEAGSILTAHQSVVAGRSPVWDAMLNHDMRETQTAKLTLADVDEQCFKPFLYLLYTGELPADLAKPKPGSDSETDLQTVLSMVVLADRFQVAGFREVFETCLRQMIRLDSSIATVAMTGVGLPGRGEYFRCLNKAVVVATGGRDVLDVLQQVETKVFRHMPSDTSSSLAARAHILRNLAVRITVEAKLKKDHDRFLHFTALLDDFVKMLHELPDRDRQRKRRRCDAPAE